MAERLPMRLVFGGDYDRIRPLRDGSIKPEGLELQVSLVDTPHKAFHALTHGDHFDGGEMSMSFYSTFASKHGKDNPLIALPVFISRMFRHGNILVNVNSGIETPKDLEGRTFGMPEYGMTMAVWIRQFLQKDHGVDIRKVKWREGRRPVALGDEIHYPKDVPIETFDSGKPLLEMLSAGDIDAFCGIVPTDLPPNTRRLFPDYVTAEKAYYTKHKVFPIMHVLVLQRTFHEAHPWVAASLYQAACAARDFAVAELHSSAVHRVSMPWVLPIVQEQERLFGGQLWPYGIEANRPTIETYLQTAYEQGLLWRELRAEDCFLPFN